MKNKIIFTRMLVDYFGENWPSSSSYDFVLDLGMLLGDDAIYGAISNGPKYLANRINEKANKKHLGQIIIHQIDELLEMEYNLYRSKNINDYQNIILYKLDNFKKLSFTEELIYKNLIDECDYILSSEEEIFIDDLKCSVKYLSDYQKFLISKSITEGKKEYYTKKINRTYEIISNLIKNNLGKKYTFYKNM